MNREELTERTKKFAHRCVKLATALPDTKLADILEASLSDARHRLQQTIGQRAFLNLTQAL